VDHRYEGGGGGQSDDDDDLTERQVTSDSPLDRHERRFDGDFRREAPPRGTRTLNAILPNRRTVWLRVETPLAPAAELRRVADLAQHGGRWQRAGTKANRDSIRRLAQQLVDDARKLTESRLDRAERWRDRIVARHHTADRRLAKAAAEHRARIASQIEIERETVRRMRRRDLWDKILIATSLPLFAAYGQRGKPFGVNNLTLLISLLIWLVGDEVADTLFRSSEKSPYPLRDTDAWSYIAPVGNLLGGWWLMSGLQHERFVAGFTREFAPDGPPTKTAEGYIQHIYVSEVPLADIVAAEHFEDFQTFKDVPAVATIRTARLTAPNAAIEGVTATVNDVAPGFVTRGKPGILTLKVTIVAPDPGVVPIPPVLDALEVAWMVDTQDPELSKPT
jgi:hypothetical protein